MRQGKLRRNRFPRKRHQRRRGFACLAWLYGQISHESALDVHENSSISSQAKKPKKQQRASATLGGDPKAFRAEVQQLLEQLADPASRGTLSDRLNPSHPRFDKKLKAQWKDFSKKDQKTGSFSFFWGGG